jgi:hypothetical protein
VYGLTEERGIINGREQTMADKINLRDVTGDEQSQLLVSKRDRMVSIYRPTNDPIFNNRELVATVTVTTDPDGSVSIGLGYTPSRNEVYVEFVDDDQT